MLFLIIYFIIKKKVGQDFSTHNEPESDFNEVFIFIRST